MTEELRKLVELILSANTCTDIFGTNKKRAKNLYHSYARQVHPDNVKGIDTESVDFDKVFGKLSEFWEEFKNGGISASAASNTINSGRTTYTLKGVDFENDRIKVFRAVSSGGDNVQLVVERQKLKNEAYDLLIKIAEQKEYTAFFPKAIDEFAIAQPDGEHAVYAQSVTDGFISLRRIKNAFDKSGQTIDGRDIAWIWRRVLTALGTMYDAEVLHNGLSDLDNILIHPAEHGLIITGWYAGEFKQSASDLNDIAKVFYELSADAPKDILNFFRGCLGKNVYHPFTLLEEFDNLLSVLYGERKFHEFNIPANIEEEL
ncbi:hypothetical protein AGMMS49975_11350 [Clostridia bacterium]|nr:hypothetical protein AGMMS49975_11350 [Clostridia bacterium]